MGQNINTLKAGAAGIAYQTRGRSRVFSSKGPIDDSAEQIADALEEREAKQNPPDEHWEELNRYFDDDMRKMDEEFRMLMDD